VALVETTADVGLRITAPSLDELFARALRGVCYLIAESVRPPLREERSVTLEADDPEELLVAWLSWVIAVFDGEAWLAVDARVSVRGSRLQALVSGGPWLPEYGEIWHYVKGVTYHELEIQRTPEGDLTATVILDV
jgi:SHS2 domain-containing protein